MKAIALFLGLIFFLHVDAQQRHFELYGEARMSDNMVYCDLKAADDYDIASMQFGFHHDSRSSQFIGIESDIKELKNNHFNEVCPNYIRMTWNHSNGDHITVSKGQIVISLVYQINREEPYFICMMDNGRDKCENFLREVLDGDFEKYVVNDICVEYRLKDDKAVVTDVLDDLREKSRTQFRVSDQSLYVWLPEAASSRRVVLVLTDMRGKRVGEHVLTVGDNKIQTGALVAGNYTFSIVMQGHLLRSGKFVKS